MNVKVSRSHQLGTPRTREKLLATKSCLLELAHELVSVGQSVSKCTLLEVDAEFQQAHDVVEKLRLADNRTRVGNVVHREHVHMEVAV